MSLPFLSFLWKRELLFGGAGPRRSKGRDAIKALVINVEPHIHVLIEERTNLHVPLLSQRQREAYRLGELPQLGDSQGGALSVSLSRPRPPHSLELLPHLLDLREARGSKVPRPVVERLEIGPCPECAPI